MSVLDHIWEDRKEWEEKEADLWYSDGEDDD